MDISASRPTTGVEPAGSSEGDPPLSRRYGRAKLVLALIEMVVPLVVLAAITLTGASDALYRYAHPTAMPRVLGDLGFLLWLGALTRGIQFPVQLLDQWWVERTYGLSCQSLRGWLWEWLCKTAIFGAVAVASLLALVESLRWSPLLALPWSIAFLLGRRLFYDGVYYPLMEYFYPSRLLRHETFNLPGIGKQTLPVYQVKVSHKTRRVDASIRLRGPKTAIYVTDTLIDEFTDGEERVVMAHEFGHLYDHLHLETNTRAGIAQAHRKLMLGTAQLLAGVVSLFVLQALSPALHLAGAVDLRGFPLLSALTLGLSHVFQPLLCREARRDERDADEYALAITGDVENYCSVMEKLRRINLEERDPHPLGHFLLDTHPSYSERLNAAMKYRRRYAPRRKTRAWRGWKNIQHHGRR